MSICHMLEGCHKFNVLAGAEPSTRSSTSTTSIRLSCSFKVHTQWLLSAMLTKPKQQSSICPVTPFLPVTGVSILLIMMIFTCSDNKHRATPFIWVTVSWNIPTTVDYCAVCKLHSDLIQADKWPVSSHPCATQHALPFSYLLPSF